MPFFGTWKRQKCPFSRAKKWHFERPDLRTESKNLAKHPPKWLGRHSVHAFPFLAEYQANFWKSCFKRRFGPVSPSIWDQNFKSLAKCRLWVYNAEIFFVGSGNYFAPVVQPRKQNSKKVFFWDTLATTAKQFHVPSAALSLSLWPVIVLYRVKMPCDDKAPNNEKHSPSKEENHCIDDGLPRYLQKSLDQNQILSKNFAYCGPQEGSWE